MHRRVMIRWFAFTLCLCYLSACGAAPTPQAMTAVTPTALRIESPTDIAAGEPLPVTVYVSPPTPGVEILLTAQGSFGFLPQTSMAHEDHAHFTLSAAHTRRAGTVTLRALAGAIVSTATVTIAPGRAVDPVVPLVAPRSIVADGEHWTMAVLTPRDHWHNPVAEGTAVTLLTQYPVAPGIDPKSGLQSVEILTQNLLGWSRIKSGTGAGKLLISAHVDDAHSPERTVLAVPGPPITFTLQASPAQVPADGHQWIQLQSSQITDRFGNVLLDGTHATIVAALPPADMRVLPAMTVDGRIYAQLQAPTAPGILFARAWIGAVSSPLLPMTITPGPAVEPIAVSMTKQNELLLIKAGPLVGARKQFVPDGTTVIFHLLAADALTSHGVTEDTAILELQPVVMPAEYGYATLEVRTASLLPGKYDVVVSAGTGVGSGQFVISASGDLSGGNAYDGTTPP